jgi:hypothetical protein
MTTATRPAAVAGMFYPADAATLARTVAAHLAQVPPPAGEVQPKMLLVPHAGFIYSGPVAAHAYALLSRWRDRIRRVVLLGPGHRVAVRGLAAPQATRFETPLGPVPVDTAALALLADLPQVGASDAAHAQEHSLEVQLPFLQAVLAPGFTVVPLVVGHASDADVAQVLERLWGGDETLILISSDLSHYKPYADAQAVDRATIDHVLALDAGFGHNQACGATPLRGALQQARRHGLGARLLDLRNSGDTAGDRARVVGYASVAFEPISAAGDEPSAASPEAERALGMALLTRAHNAIARVLGRPTVDEPAHPALESPGATFVTLQRNHHLRGCIGTLQAERPLTADVRHNALAAAFRDPRFEPLSVAEWRGLTIEVSLLEPAQPLPAFATEAAALAALVPQQDGVIFEWHGHRATFLPQVWEQLPRPQAFMAALKRKAGLSADFWADDVRLSRYRVRKFQTAPLEG